MVGRAHCFRMQTPISTDTVPRKLYVELATVCNLHCAMCVKHSAGWTCPDTLMDVETYRSLAPLFPHLTTLVLNGIGESLLHPDLPELLAFARERTPLDCCIGLQSNGMLLTPGLAARLADAGLDRICFSVDSSDPSEMARLRAGAELGRVGGAFGVMAAAASRPGIRDVEVGAETVVSTRNIAALPETVAWCAEQGARFVLVSHVLPYHRSVTSLSLYTPVSSRCVAFCREWAAVLTSEGIDLRRAYDAFYAVFRTPSQQRQVEAMLAMVEEARTQDLQFSLPKVLQVDPDRLERVREIFGQAETVAVRRGIRLDLPAQTAREPRRCPFVEEPSLFVASDGALAPCYYLWHDYAHWLTGAEIRVRQRVFGRLPEDDPHAVWNAEDFQRFRREARAEEYARCADCSVVPCDFVQGYPHPFERDCYGQTVPCGSCPWSGGGFACMQ